MATIPGIRAQNRSGASAEDQVITPAPLPTDLIGDNNLQVIMSNQLALQLAQLFQDLFPVAIDYQFETQFVNDQSLLQGRVEVLVDDINQIKMTILTINQITNLATSRIPNGYSPGGPNSGASNIAGLSTSTNNNQILDILNRLYTDVTASAFGAAQSDYARLRNQLQPYFNL